jgi:hypothetical protein
MLTLRTKVQLHLKDCDGGDLYMSIFWTFSIVLVFETRRFGDWICLRYQVNKINKIFYSPEDGDRSSLRNVVF